MSGLKLIQRSLHCGLFSDMDSYRESQKSLKMETTQIYEQEEKMSYADQVFISMCRNIIDNGTSTEGEKSARNGKMVRRHIPSNSLAW